MGGRKGPSGPREDEMANTTTAIRSPTAEAGMRPSGPAALAAHGRSRRAALLVSALVMMTTGVAAKPPASIPPVLMLESVRPADRGPQAARYGITRRDLEAIVPAVPGLVAAVPIRWQQQEVRRGAEVATARLVGTTADYRRLHEVDMAGGRFLNDADTDRLRNVAVLSSRIARQLFGAANPIGESIRAGRQSFTVVGVLAAGDPTTRHDVYLPLATMRARLGDTVVTQTAGAFKVERYEISRLELHLAEWPDVAPTTALVTQLLQHLHDDDSVRVIDTQQDRRDADHTLSPSGETNP